MRNFLILLMLLSCGSVFAETFIITNFVNRGYTKAEYEQLISNVQNQINSTPFVTLGDTVISNRQAISIAARNNIDLTESNGFSQQIRLAELAGANVVITGLIFFDDNISFLNLMFVDVSEGAIILDFLISAENGKKLQNEIGSFLQSTTPGAYLIIKSSGSEIPDFAEWDSLTAWTVGKYGEPFRLSKDWMSPLIRTYYEYDGKVRIIDILM